jgi:hypothetical protein
VGTLNRLARNGNARWMQHTPRGDSSAAKPITAPRRRNRSVSTAQTDQAWFEHKVAELKAELEKLPADRHAHLKRELEEQD